MKFYLMKKSGVILFALTMGLVLSSCSKKSDSTGPAGSSHKITSAKFTITVTGLNSGDGATFDFSTTGQSGNSTYWKINGVTHTNENVISVQRADFLAQNTQTIELTQPVDIIDVGVACVNSDAPFTVSYTAEINGKVVKTITNQSVVAGVNFSPTFTYP